MEAAIIRHYGERYRKTSDHGKQIRLTAPQTPTWYCRMNDHSLLAKRCKASATLLLASVGPMAWQHGSVCICVPHRPCERRVYQGSCRPHLPGIFQQHQPINRSHLDPSRFLGFNPAQSITRYQQPIPKSIQLPPINQHAHRSSHRRGLGPRLYCHGSTRTR